MKKLFGTLLYQYFLVLIDFCEILAGRHFSEKKKFPIFKVILLLYETQKKQFRSWQDGSVSKDTTHMVENKNQNTANFSLTSI